MANRSDVFEDKWYKKPIFTSFWNHYNQCHNWLEQNGQKMVEFSDEIDDNPRQDSEDTSVKTLDTSREEIEFNRTDCKSVHRLDTLESINENEMRFGENQSSELIPIDDNEVLDISEEYLEFIMKTKRHQIERKRLREKRLRYNERIEYIDISRLDSFSRRSVAPKRPEKVDFSLKDNKDHKQELSEQEVKSQKMFELYGEDYNVIQGMEAALQLNFDRLCDINQPKFWPIMPIRIENNHS